MGDFWEMGDLPASWMKKRPLPDSFILQVPVPCSSANNDYFKSVSFLIHFTYNCVIKVANYLSLHLGRSAGVWGFVGSGWKPPDTDLTSPDFPFASPDFVLTSSDFVFASLDFLFSSPDFVSRELWNSQRSPFPSSSQASQQLCTVWDWDRNLHIMMIYDQPHH